MNIEKGNSEYYKISVVKDKKEIGRCFIFLIRNELHKNPYALLEDVFVDESMRGQGIGTELVKKAIELAKNLGCYKIIATSRETRENVHKLYEKLGFKKWGFEFRIDFNGE
ncbi:MAG: GNAT family N-acetyltransferase [Nitrososphaerota archaeon]|nr:GNAT family N-acetyltransferase [Candidatus Aenigmarchaeota archaeon]